MNKQEWCSEDDQYKFKRVARGKARCLKCNRRLNIHSHSCGDPGCFHAFIKPHKKR